MIRNLQFKDLPKVAEIFQDLFSKNEWNFTWLTYDKTLGYFMDIYNTPKFKGYIYEMDNEIIGCTLGAVNDYFQFPQFEIKEIFIEQSFRHQGIGSIFLDYIENDLKNLGVQIVTLHTQRSIQAFDFYNKKNYLQSTDSVHMVKILN